MNVSDEMLMAYVDGELDADTEANLEAQMRRDPDLAERVAQHRALKAKLSGAFDGVLDEAIPERLVQAANAQPRAPVADLAAARAAKRPRERAHPSSWKAWTAIAASVLLAVLVGRTLLQPPRTELVATTDAGLIAAGPLAQALSTQITGEAPQESRVATIASFRNKDGEYCRTFVAGAPEHLAGIACRTADQWRVHSLSDSGGKANENYRMAQSSVPAIVLQTMESMRVGEPLDATEEAAARAKDWR